APLPCLCTHGLPWSGRGMTVGFGGGETEKPCADSGTGCCGGLSARCVLSCLRRLDDTTNDLEHIWHLKGRSPECTLRCLLRLERSANDLPHSVQENGRSPVCTSMCRRKSHDATKALSQFWHLYGLWPECTRWCTARSAGCRNLLLEGSENILPHCGQRKGFSPECVRRWDW
uniref:Uncharacterized protein n=1 Tax=Electrophorus electricus TaxID=8005 RepID=A0A4W4EJZ2_ELEEL